MIHICSNKKIVTNDAKGRWIVSLVRDAPWY